MHILWLKTELLHPVDKGGKIRTYHMLKELKGYHRITYLTLDDGTAPVSAHSDASQYCHELVCVPHRQATKFTHEFYKELAFNAFSPVPYFIEKYRSRQMQKCVSELLRERSVDLVVCDFLNPSVNWPADVTCPSVLFQHNVEALIWKRHYEVQRNIFKKAYFFEQWRKTRNYEKKACGRFDQVIAVSKEDREMIEREYVLRKVSDIPTGVDTEYFVSSRQVAPERNHLVFTGSMDWLPNDDAMRFFAEAIFPRIRHAVPDARLTVVGRNPLPRLVEMSRQDPFIKVVGRVDDVRPYMERASVYVIPLRIGGGTRLKVYEAMAMGMPIVSTRVGAEGLSVRDREHLLLADSPEDFATCVIQLLSNGEEAQALGLRAAATARTEFGWKRVAEQFALICQETIEGCRHSIGNRTVC